MLVQLLKRNDRKLVHQINYLDFIANRSNLSFMYYCNKANKKIEVLAKRLNIDLNLYILAPANNGNDIVILKR